MDTLKVQGIDSKGYGKIPKLVMQDEDLTIEAKGIYAYLASYAGAGETAFPSVSLTCHQLGISERRYHKHRKLLEDKGYLLIHRERAEVGFTKNIYTLANSVSLQNVSVRNVSVQNVSLQNVGTNNNSIKNNNINNNNTNNNTHDKRASESDLKERFDSIWKNYPNKKGKSKAFTSYKKAVKEGTTDDEIIQGINNYLKEIEIKGTAKQYIKHGSTWFNNKGWEDDYDHTPNKPKGRNNHIEPVPEWFNNQQPTQETNKVIDLDEEALRKRMKKVLGDG